MPGNYGGLTGHLPQTRAVIIAMELSPSNRFQWGGHSRGKGTVGEGKGERRVGGQEKYIIMDTEERVEQEPAPSLGTLHWLLAGGGWGEMGGGAIVMSSSLSLSGHLL